MSLPSDLNADVAEAVEAAERRRPKPVDPPNNSLFRKVSSEQVGFAAAAIVAFLGIAVCGPKVYEMRHPRRPRLDERARRAARQVAHETRRRAEAARDETRRKLSQVGERVARL